MKAIIVLVSLACIVLMAHGACVTSDGTVVQEGATVKPTPCEFCTCHGSHLMCAIQDCAFPPCENYSTPPGQCCPVCHNVG